MTSILGMHHSFFVSHTRHEAQDMSGTWNKQMNKNCENSNKHKLEVLKKMDVENLPVVLEFLMVSVAHTVSSFKCKNC
jgi:hypothetical protein